VKRGSSRISSEYQRALALVESGRPNMARPLLAEHVRIDPDNIEARYLLGVCEKAAGDLDLAEATFRKVIARMPTHHQALYGLGLVLESKGNIAEAVELWKKALSIKPNFDYAARKLSEYGIVARQAKPKPRAKQKQLLQKRLIGIGRDTSESKEEFLWERFFEIGLFYSM
jgi:tetratricopeptide (TPR) repeat protein